jgi:hypothetical protein
MDLFPIEEIAAEHRRRRVKQLVERMGDGQWVIPATTRTAAEIHAAALRELLGEVETARRLEAAGFDPSARLVGASLSGGGIATRQGRWAKLLVCSVAEVLAVFPELVPLAPVSMPGGVFNPGPSGKTNINSSQFDSTGSPGLGGLTFVAYWNLTLASPTWTVTHAQAQYNGFQDSGVLWTSTLETDPYGSDTGTRGGTPAFQWQWTIVWNSSGRSWAGMNGGNGNANAGNVTLSVVYPGYLDGRHHQTTLSISAIIC